MNTRRANAEIIIAGKNVTEYITPFLKSVSYTDVLDGEADTAQINLSDEKRLFINDWFPTRGDTCDIKFIYRGGDYFNVMNLSEFEIDEITNSINSSGNSASIKLNSIANKSELRAVNKSRSWENVKLSKIAQDIADDAELKLVYDTDEDPTIERAEQKEKSNLAFLYGLCKKNYLALKVSEGKLIVFEISKLEKLPAVKTLIYGESDIISFSGQATISKIYKSCHVKYQNGKRAEKQDYTYTDESKESGMVLEVNEKVSSQAEAEKLSKKRLREKNREEWKVNLKVLGSFEYLAGNNIELKNFGKYDAKYIIDKATHKIGGGYTVDLELRKCLE